MMLKILGVVSLTCAAIVFGLTWAHVLELPGKRQLGGAEWLQVQHTFYGGFAVVGGLGEIVGLLASAAALPYVRGRRVSLTLYLVATLSFLGMLLSYWFGNRPINDQIAVWTAASLPPDWQSYRDRWDAAHTLSAVFAALAFAVLLGALVRDTDISRRTVRGVASRQDAG